MQSKSEYAIALQQLNLWLVSDEFYMVSDEINIESEINDQRKKCISANPASRTSDASLSRARSPLSRLLRAQPPPRRHHHIPVAPSSHLLLDAYMNAGLAESLCRCESASLLVIPAASGGECRGQKTRGKGSWRARGVKKARMGQKSNPQVEILFYFYEYLLFRRPSPCIFRSYHPEHSDTHQNIELKHDWAGLVLG